MILVVEDDAVLLGCIADVLRGTGRRVLLAESGRAAMRHVETYRAGIKALVTDHHLLHGLNGTDLVMYMRPTHPTIPMVLLTGDPDAVSDTWITQHQVHLVTKPMRTSALMTALGFETDLS